MIMPYEQDWKESPCVPSSGKRSRAGEGHLFPDFSSSFLQLMGFFYPHYMEWRGVFASHCLRTVI